MLLIPHGVRTTGPQMKPAAALLLLAASAHAGVLDQHNDGPLLGGTSIGTIGTAVDQSAAQTITVGIGGIMDRVEMYIYADGTPGFPMVLRIVPVTAGLPDDSTILATGTLTPAPTGLQWVSFDLSGANLAVTPGRQLALILRSGQHLDQGQYVVEGTADLYPGASFVRSFSGPWNPINNYDLMFRTYVVPAEPSCYANCDHSTTVPALNVLDFICFLDEFAAGDPYANCDQSTTPPVLNVLDFTCFLNRFAAGCP